MQTDVEGDGVTEIVDENDGDGHLPVGAHWKPASGQHTASTAQQFSGPQGTPCSSGRILGSCQCTKHNESTSQETVNDAQTALNHSR